MVLRVCAVLLLILMAGGALADEVIRQPLVGRGELKFAPPSFDGASYFAIFQDGEGHVDVKYSTDSLVQYFTFFNQSYSGAMNEISIYHLIVGGRLKPSQAATKPGLRMMLDFLFKHPLHAFDIKSANDDDVWVQWNGDDGYVVIITKRINHGPAAGESTTERRHE